MQSERSGKIQTVLGLIEPDELGITLTHEHALIDLSCYFVMPEEATERWYIDKPVTMD
ncbi:MAG: phosphotriesterase-related protein, partial [Dehalococcoidia bacterium]|nr:phosphotriesterase-related protein [Dehalococcoidia bacterium]